MNKRIALALAVCLLAALLAGCAAGAQKGEATPTVSEAVIPAPSEPAATPTPVPLSGNLKIIGSAAVGPLMVDLADLFTKKNPLVEAEILQPGSVPGIVSVQTGEADIGMSSRPLTKEQSNLIQQVLCLDALAVIVHPTSSVTALTREQIAAIFSGKVSDWSEIGGGSAQIEAYSREPSDARRASFEEMVPVSINNAACAVLDSDEDIAKAVENDPNAIGIVPLRLALTKDYHVLPLRVDGAEATEENAASGAYPLCRPLLLLTGGNESEAAKAFLAWLRGDPDAKALIEQRLYLPPNE